MKAIMADFSLGREVWDRFRSTVFKKGARSHSLFATLTETSEPAMVSSRWLKIRTIMSGISDIEEGILLSEDPSPFGAFVSSPFVPGNELLGIVTDAGDDVHGIEPGERVVINPLLSCEAREIEPLCPSCAHGDPSSCRNFARGILSPGIMIGGCKDTGGGWGDYVIAHKSQVRVVPQSMASDHAILVPQFARALRGVLKHAPALGERVIVMGGGPLGQLTTLALRRLGHEAQVLLVVEHPFEADVARKLGQKQIVIAHGPGDVYEQVAELLEGSVIYPRFGHIHLEGGADLVFETTGKKSSIEHAIRFAGEGKKLVLMGLAHPSGLDMSPVWFKSVQVFGTVFSGVETHNGEITNTFDVAMDMVAQNGLPYEDLITHRFKLADYRLALETVADPSSNKAIKAVFQHVV
ncbi:MAG: alcohol dehydrogenase catalytic domain-containing protein [Thermodesulfobacteriota bacterium]